MQYDLCIIGAGPGGYRAAEYAAQQGLQVVIIEKDEVGGTCLNRGCIPTKTYVHSATFAEALERQQQVVQHRALPLSVTRRPSSTAIPWLWQVATPSVPNISSLPRVAAPRCLPLLALTPTQG